MNKLRTLIIDDEKQARISLLSELKKYLNRLEIVGEAHNVESAVETINRLKPDLVFLDINLGDGSGFNVIEQSVFKKFKVIFVTAYEQYAVRAFKVSALDFLLKPIDIDELKLAIEKLATQTELSSTSKSLEVFNAMMDPASKSEKKIVLKDLESIHVVKLSELLCCEASGIYTTFYLSDRTQIVVSKNLKEYEDLLESFGFLRVHNSFLVNTSKILRFDKADGGLLILEADMKVPVSQRKRDVVIEFFKNL